MHMLSSLYSGSTYDSQHQVASEALDSDILLQDLALSWILSWHLRGLTVHNLRARSLCSSSDPATGVHEKLHDALPLNGAAGCCLYSTLQLHGNVH